MKAKRWVLGGALVSLGLAGCGETRYDLYRQAMEREGEAERGPCKLEYADNSQAGDFMSAATISGDQIASCLAATDEVLALYERAAAKGNEGAEFQAAFERARARKERLASMLRHVREMERASLVPPGSP